MLIHYQLTETAASSLGKTTKQLNLNMQHAVHLTLKIKLLTGEKKHMNRSN